MKILYFWVTGVTQTAIQSMLSNVFQETTRCYNSKPEKYTGYRYTTGIHASIQHIHIFATYCVLRRTTKNHRLKSSFIYTGMIVLASVGLDWHSRRNLFFPAVFSSETQQSVFLSE